MNKSPFFLSSFYLGIAIFFPGSAQHFQSPHLICVLVLDEVIARERFVSKSFSLLVSQGIPQYLCCKIIKAWVVILSN